MAGNDQTGQLFPPINKATDLPSALQAIVALTQAVTLMASSTSTAPTNNLVEPNAKTKKLGPQFSGKKASDNKNQNTQRYVEVDRVTQKVKVVNPDDDTQFVIVERLTSVTFLDKLTGTTIQLNDVQ